MATDGAIRDNDYSAWSLEQKLAWLDHGPGTSGTYGTQAALSELGAMFAAADPDIRSSLASVGVDWQGGAADAARTALDKAADRADDSGVAQTRGAAYVDQYGMSFTTMAGAVRPLAPPKYTFWNKAEDALLDPMFGVQSDHKDWVEEYRTLDAAANTALKTHEAATRDALASFPDLGADVAPAQPGDQGPGPDPGDPHDPITPGGVDPAYRPGNGVAGTDVPTTPGGRGSEGVRAGGSAPHIPGLSGGDHGAQPHSPAPGTATPGHTTPSLPGLGVAGTSTAGHVPPGQQAPGSSTPPAWASTAGAPAAGSASFGPGALGGGSFGAGSGPFGAGPLSARPPDGRRVSTGPEFASRLPTSGLPTSGLPTEETTSGSRADSGGGVNGATARGGRTASGGAGAANGPGPDDLPHSSGAGGGATTRRTRYVIPSSDAFDVPLPTHVVGGLLGPAEDDEPYPW